MKRNKSSSYYLICIGVLLLARKRTRKRAEQKLRSLSKILYTQMRRIHTSSIAKLEKVNAIRENTSFCSPMPTLQPMTGPVGTVFHLNYMHGLSRIDGEPWSVYQYRKYNHERGIKPGVVRRLGFVRRLDQDDFVPGWVKGDEYAYTPEPPSYETHGS